MDDHINSDYEVDFLAWIEHQAELLRAKHFEQLDLDNLIEELEYMARKEKREIKNRLKLLTRHLLKYQFQAKHISHSWIHTIREQRNQIELQLEDMPSLKSAIDGYISDNYRDASFAQT